MIQLVEQHASKWTTSFRDGLLISARRRQSALKQSRAVNRLPAVTEDVGLNLPFNTELDVDVTNTSSVLHKHSKPRKQTFTGHARGRREQQLGLFGRLLYTEQDRSVHVGVYRKPPTDQSWLFDSHHPLKHKFRVIRRLKHQADSVPSAQAQETEHRHQRERFKACGSRKTTNTKIRDTGWRTMSIVWTNGLKEE